MVVNDEQVKIDQWRSRRCRTGYKAHDADGARTQIDPALGIAGQTYRCSRILVARLREGKHSGLSEYGSLRDYA